MTNKIISKTHCHIASFTLKNSLFNLIILKVLLFFAFQKANECPSLSDGRTASRFLFSISQIQSHNSSPELHTGNQF